MNVQACTVTGCSATAPTDRLYLYPPGQPAVQSLAPASGSRSGDTKVLIGGANLNCPLGVSFGEHEARSFKAAGSDPSCDSPTAAVEAISPAGDAGKVPVTVTTWESYFSGGGDAPGGAEFTYRG